MKKKGYTTYMEVLNPTEVLQVGSRVTKFERGEVSYPIFDILMQDVGITIEPVFKNIDINKLSRTDAIALKERILSHDLNPRDIDHYVMSNGKTRNFIVRHDREMIQMLAENGDIKAKRTMELIRTRETSVVSG